MARQLLDTGAKVALVGLNLEALQSLAKLAPEMNPLHMESLALAVGSTLNGMPHEFFEDVAALARRMGADRLAQVHEGMI